MERRAAVAIIGAGTAGLAALAAVRETTEDVVLIDRGPLGTTCARVGCMPSKLLIAAGDAAEAVRRAATFGIAAEPAVDGRAVMARVRTLRDAFVAGVRDRIAALPEGMLLLGEARLRDGAIRVATAGGEVTVHAGRTVVATGSHPLVPGPLRHPATVTSDDVFAWDALPASVAVFGAGAIGLELAMALARLGVEVRLFGKDGAIGGLTDPAVIEAAWRAIGTAVDAVRDHELLEVAGDGDHATVRYRADGREFSATFERLLVAVGRVSRRDGLVPDDAAADPVTRQVGEGPLFLAGDAADDRPLLHEASWSGTAAGRNAAAWPDLAAVPRLPFLSVTFTRPEIAIVGESRAALERRGADVVTGTARFDEQGRARIEGRAAGLLHLYGEAGSGRLLGAEMVAPGGEHLAHLVVLALRDGLTAADLARLPFYHPTLEEGLRTAACALSAAVGRALPAGSAAPRHGAGG
jgi:dihydrolipoamide dehydrogenase